MTFRTLHKYTVRDGQRLVLVQHDCSIPEFRVRLIVDGVKQVAADYFTNDQEDAIATANTMVKDPAAKKDVPPETTTFTIDMTPTWGEVGNIVKRFAMSRETKALSSMWSEVARAMAAAQALQAITKTLTDEQRSIVSKTLVAELNKQGY